MTETTEFEGFPRGLVDFLAALQANTNATWFKAHRGDYESLMVAPARAFVVAIGARLGAISRGIRADPRSGGSLMRVNRDTRFSRDKTPYKSWLDLWFWEGEKRSRECPGLFFRLRPDMLTLGAGMHMFGKPELETYRAAVVDPKLGRALRSAITEVRSAGEVELGGRQYKRVPAGFDAAHENAELLLHNGLYAGADMAPVPDVMFAAGAVDYCLEGFRRWAPIQQWLVKALATVP